MKHAAVKKMLAFAVCLLFIVVALLSVAVVLAQSRHEHDHDGPEGTCAACIHLMVAGNILKLITGGLVCAVFGSGRFSAIRSTIKAACFHADLSTLVHQKIKLNI